MLACQSEKPKQIQIKELREALQKPAQEFSFTAEQGTEIMGKEGTYIKIPPDVFEYENGTPAKGQVSIFLTEYYQCQDMLLNGLSTTSETKLLETAGMIYLVAEINKKPLKLKDGKRCEIGFPIPKMKKEGMVLFNGEFNEDAYFIDWQEQILGDTIADTETSVSKYAEEAIDSNEVRKSLEYYLFSSSSLNWLNCDKYLDKSEGGRLVVHADEKLKPVVRLLYKPFRTMSAGVVQADKSVVFSPLAVGADATLFAFSKVDGKIHLATKDITITGEMEVNLEFKEVTLEQLKAEAKKLEWEDAMASK